MTPSLQQAIALLQKNQQELQKAVREELAANPVLEATEPSEERAAEQEGQDTDSAGDDPFEDYDFAAYEKYLDAGEPAFRPRSWRDEDAPTIEKTLETKETLSDHLMWQLQMNAQSEEIVKAGKAIIGNLNADGYLDTSLEEVEASEAIPFDHLKEALVLIQYSDPVGVAARSIEECLLIQLRHLGVTDEKLLAFVSDHLHLLEDKDYPKISELLHCSLDDVEHYIEIIQRLDPKPGSMYTTETTQYVIPDVYVAEMDGEFKVWLNDEGLPKLTISRFYRQLIARKATKNHDETVRYIQKKLRDALWLLKSIDQRQETIRKVSESIVRHQEDFLRRGIKHIRPLVLKDIADDIGRHESTVSRVVKDKYIHTPRGTLEMKFFFHSGLRKDGGDDVSSLLVKDKIKNIVEGEDSRRPLSDATIVEGLSQEGIHIARRTVAKYRQELDIPSSTKRRRRG